MSQSTHDSVTLFWSFRSPYSYLAMPRLMSLQESTGVTLNIRVVHPNILRNPNYFKTMNPLARPYFLKDTQRMADFLGMPFRRPTPDPIQQDPETLEVSQTQPLARWLGQLGIAATEQGRGVEFCWEIAQLLWNGKTDGWDQGEHLFKASERAGLDWNTLSGQVAQKPEYFEQQLQMNADALTLAGHWGVPTMVFQDEVFFGQDRLDVLAWRVRQHFNP